MIPDPQLPAPGPDSQLAPASALAPVPGAGIAAHTDTVKAFTKATNREVNDRVHQVAMMLARRVAKFRIKRFLREKHGIKARQAEVYISRSKAYLVERSQRDRNDIFAEIFANYEAMIADPASADRVRLEALRAIREMCGCDAPRKTALTTPDGEHAVPLVNVDIERLTIEQRRAALEIVMALAAPAAGSQEALPVAAPSVA